ncbi:hypothetical protein Pmani_007721 [Petrolisthes manimaculis]|uniref:Uncharacterized protein n=1 Tax=Petrolisthes manimaculis TaxID=1843537 RepID=A0AAE1Q6X7_9EUCA|nr:hypothetical protein Pmani_007721 [Petrolisthes manimaculis]
MGDRTTGISTPSSRPPSPPSHLHTIISTFIPSPPPSHHPNPISTPSSPHHPISTTISTVSETDPWPLG